MFLIDRRKMTMVAPDKALPGRSTPLPTAERHFLSGIALQSAVPDGFEQAMFGMGCFWGVERKFYNLRGVWLTMTGSLSPSNTKYHTPPYEKATS